jgi:hypothetical protein
MSDSPVIPEDLRNSFEWAIDRFPDWDGGRELEVTYKHGTEPLGEIFRMVAMCLGQAPDHIYARVAMIAQKFREGEEAAFGHARECDGPKDRSYAGVARSMCDLHRARDALFKRRTGE